LLPELLKGEALKNFAVGGHVVVLEILRRVRRSFDFWFYDDAAADEIDNVAEFGMAPHLELGTWEAARRTSDGLVVIEVTARKMEDIAIFQLEEIMRTLQVEFVDAKGLIGAEVGDHKKPSRFKFLCEVVHHGMARQARVVEADGDDDNKNAEVGNNNDKSHRDAGVTEVDEGHERARGESEKHNQPNQQRLHTYPQAE